MALKTIGSVSVKDIDSAFFEQLEKNEEAIDSFLKDVATFVRGEAKKSSEFVDLTGNLRKSIGMKKSKYPRGGYIVKASGRNRISGATRAKGFHAHLVEEGHVKVLWGKRTTERVPPHRFMTPALERGYNYAVTKIREMNLRG